MCYIQTWPDAARLLRWRKANITPYWSAKLTLFSSFLSLIRASWINENVLGLPLTPVRSSIFINLESLCYYYNLRKTVEWKKGWLFPRDLVETSLPRSGKDTPAQEISKPGSSSWHLDKWKTSRVSFGTKGLVKKQLNLRSCFTHTASSSSSSFPSLPGSAI